MKSIFFSTLLLNVFFLTVGIHSLSAQDVDGFFDDGYKKRPSILKLNITSPIIGDVSAHYEYIIKEKVGIEIGGGIQMPYYLPDNLMALSTLGEYMMNNVKGGHSMSAQIKIYKETSSLGFDPGYPGAYLGFIARRRQYDLAAAESNPAQQLTFTDLMIVEGLQQEIGLEGRLLIDASMGIGVRLAKLPFMWESSFTTPQHFVYSFNIKIGYMF